jgi:predicted ABC-type ATPase
LRVAIIIAGPNGAGKTTFARSFLPAAYAGAEFINADEIAAAHDQPSALQAGREMLRRIERAVDERRDFAIETTLSARIYAHRIPRWRKAGYRVALIFIELPSAAFAERRVAERVRAGGHAIPPDDIHRRFVRGRALFEQVYKPLADVWYHWKSDEEGLRLVEQS